MDPILGLEGLVTAKMTSDKAGELKYRAVQTVEGLVDVQIEDASADSEPKYADNLEKFRLEKDAKMKLTIELLAAAHDTLAEFFGHSSEDGVTAKTEDDKPPYRAFGFKADDGDGNKDGIWLKKCFPVKRTNSQTYHTKEGDSTAVQTVKVEFECMATIKDDEYMRMANSKTLAGWATWFNAVPGGAVDNS